MTFVKHMSINPYLHVIMLLSAYADDFDPLKWEDRSAMIMSTDLSKSDISYLSTIYFDFL
jgi:hypothetical protein